MRGRETAAGLGATPCCFLAPSLILFSIGLVGVGVVWFTLWLTYLVSVLHFFPEILAS